MTLPDIDALAERLNDASEEERFELMQKAASDTGRGRQLREAWITWSAARAGEIDPIPGTDHLAWEVARGRVSREAIADWDTVCWLLATLGEPSAEAIPVPAASAETRRAVDALVRPVRSRWSLVWMPALGLAAAAGIVGIAFLGPAAEPWARSLGLSRGDLWRVPADLRLDLRRAAEDGRLGEPLFDVPTVSARRERNAGMLGPVAPPGLVHPRWEAVADSRPEFRWTPEAGRRFEVLVLDADRNLLWSGTSDGANVMRYPDDAPALAPGAIYLWKVNRLGEDRVAASDYAAFRILDADQRHALDADLADVGDHAFLQGVAYDRHGLYTLAAVAFESAASNPIRREVAERARRQVLRKQSLVE